MRYLEERLPLLPAERKLADAEHEAYTVPTKDIHTFVPSCSCGDRTRYFSEGARRMRLLFVRIVRFHTLVGVAVTVA